MRNRSMKLGKNLHSANQFLHLFLELSVVMHGLYQRKNKRKILELKEKKKERN